MRKKNMVMKKYIVFKFRENEVYVYIVEAESAEYAITLYFGTAKQIGVFSVNNTYGEGGIAIELYGEELQMSVLLKPLTWFIENQKVMQNNA